MSPTATVRETVAPSDDRVSTIDGGQVHLTQSAPGLAKCMFVTIEDPRTGRRGGNFRLSPSNARALRDILDAWVNGPDSLEPVAPGFSVKVGQVWARVGHEHRRRTVLKVTETHAVLSGERMTKVLLRALHPSASRYVLIKDVP